jgi:hypothetical protein
MTKVMNLIELNKIEMKAIKSGECVWDPSGCKCACAYAGSGGGSSPFDNWQANHNGGLVSPQC